MNTTPSLFDSSVWLALTFDRHPYHAAACQAFTEASSAQPIAFCRATQQSYFRLVTTPAIQTRYYSLPISNDQAWTRCQQLLALPQVIYLEEPPGLIAHWQKYAALPSASPRVWMDAYLAAFAIRSGYQLVSADKAFSQFKGLDFHLIGNA